MSDVAEFAYEKQTEINRLKERVKTLEKQVADYEAVQSRVGSLTREIKQLQDKFTCFKGDAITSLKAIDLCILATITTQNQCLTHSQRNFRMRHVHQIILNEVASLGDRKLITYEDDY